MKFLKISGCLFVLSAVISCSARSRPHDLPKLVSCTITIQDMSGLPVEGVLVRLIPQTENKWGASGVTNAVGEVVLKTDGDFAGVVPGTYKVIITKKKQIPTGVISEETGAEVLREESYIDKTFGSVATTPCVLEVAADGKKEIFKVKVL